MDVEHARDLLERVNAALSSLKSKGALLDKTTWGVDIAELRGHPTAVLPNESCSSAGAPS